MEKAIEVKGLRKSFKDTEVLKGVDFEVKTVVDTPLAHSHIALVFNKSE